MTTSPMLRKFLFIMMIPSPLQFKYKYFDESPVDRLTSNSVDCLSANVAPVGKVLGCQEPPSTNTESPTTNQILENSGMQP